MRSLLLVLLVLLAPAHAFAWADATVRSASARVTIDDHAHAHVVMDATLRIDGGWLEALELDGLDQGLALDPLDPVTMAPLPSAEALAAGASAEPLAPTVSLRDDGVVVLAFTRRHAPRRGDYVVHLAYDAELASRARADTDGEHVDWTFPAWRHGLDSVRVEITVPSGVRPVIGSDDEIEVSQADDGAHATWTLTRAHLARTRDWPIDLAFGADILAIHVEPLAVDLPADPAGVPVAAPPRPPWQGALLLALVSLLAAVRILRARAIERRERLVMRPLVPLPSGVRALASLAIGAALMGVALVGQDVVWLAGLALALVALGLSRGAPVLAAPRLGSFRHATTTIRRLSRRARLAHHLGIDAWLDASGPAGVLLLGLLAALAWDVPSAALGPSLVALALATVLALDAARASRPEPPLVALERLLGLARRTRVALDGPALALMPVVHLDVSGVAQEARLRVLATLPEGTLRADVVVAASSIALARYALLVVVARGCPIDLALAADDAFETVAAGPARVARVTPISRGRIDLALARVLAATKETAAAEAPAQLTVAA